MLALTLGRAFLLSMSIRPALAEAQEVQMRRLQSCPKPVLLLQHKYKPLRTKKIF
jgi:hypothetical protein